MIEICRLKNVIFLQTILSFVLSRKIFKNPVAKKINKNISMKYLMLESIQRRPYIKSMFLEVLLEIIVLKILEKVLGNFFKPKYL